MRRLNGSFVIVGAGALLTGVLVFGVSLGLAVSDQAAAPTDVALEAALSPASASAWTETGNAGNALLVSAGSASDHATVEPAVLRLAVESAPFEENRREPSRRYQLPGEEPPPAPRAAARPEVPEFRMLGSMSGGSRNYAILAIEDGDPVLVATGETLSGYTLANVTDEAAVLAGGGQMLQIAMSQPSATGVSARERAQQQRARNNSNDDGDANARQAQQREAEALARAAGQLLGGGAAGGAAPMIQGLIQQFGGAAGIGGLIQAFGGGGNDAATDAVRIIERVQRAAPQGR